jgi:hypothetical protein
MMMMLMMIHFYFNDEYDFQAEFNNENEFKQVIIDYVNSTIQWVYGDKECFFQWLRDNNVAYLHLFDIHNGDITIQKQITVQQLCDFFKKWNKDFGDTQKISFVENLLV